MYMYQELRLAVLETKNDSSIPKNWSPNLIKAIFITRGSIMIAYHTRNPKILQLDMNVSIPDIQKNGSQGSLHNILAKKQLSCLEEIYVDNAFKNYQGIFNLEYYIQTLKSSMSRLRFYGYTNEVNLSEAYNKYSNARINGVDDYTFALDSTRQMPLEVVSAENDDWYKKYNLRPDIYSVDAERGVLSAWLTKVKNTVSSKMEKTLSDAKDKALLSAYKVMIKEDLKNLPSLVKIIKIRDSVLSVKYTPDGKYCYTSVGKGIGELLEDCRLQPDIAIPQKMLISILGPSPSSKEKYYVELLKKWRCILDDDKDVDFDEVIERAQNGDGLLDTKDFLKYLIENTITPKNHKIPECKHLYLIGAVKYNAPDYSSSDYIFYWLKGLINSNQIGIVLDFLLDITGQSEVRR